MNKISLKGVDKSTWIRTAVLIFALVNQAFVIFGVSDKTVDVDSVTYYASYVFTALSSLWAWWKNNSFTKKAQKADETIKSENNAQG
ncbi:MAG: phage holin [Acutalibacteraceae bacterium]